MLDVYCMLSERMALGTWQQTAKNIKVMRVTCALKHRGPTYAPRGELGYWSTHLGMLKSSAGVGKHVGTGTPVGACESVGVADGHSQ